MSGVLHKADLGDMDKMRVLGQYAVVYVVDGGGFYEDVRGHWQRITAGDLILVFPTLGHRYGPVPASGQRWSEVYLVFDGPVFELWEKTGLIRQEQPVLHLEPVDYWLSRFDSVLGAPREVGFAPPLLEVCRLQQVLAEAVVGGPTASSGPGRQSQLQWASRACALLELDRTPWLDLPGVARELGTSCASFRKRFTRVVGVPPARYRAARVIDRACELMQQGSLSDKQIAARLGFCDEFHFSRRFKKIVGVPPRVFRRRLPGSAPEART